MKILLTGANGYIGQRLIPPLIEKNHDIICCVRDAGRFFRQNKFKGLQVIEIDFLNDDTNNLPADIDVAYYLIHSMEAAGDFSKKEEQAAKNFVRQIENTNCKQVIYLTGIVNEEKLSKHLSSRLSVENILNQSKVPLTALRAGIIIGSGSASFEIIRDIVEKLPFMIAPKWLNTKCQPIAIRNVIQYLTGVIAMKSTYQHNYDITGNEVLTYKQMLQGYAAVRKLKRTIITVPVMTPRLSSYWLYFITSTSYRLAKNLVDSMKVDVTGRPNTLHQQLNIELIPYKKAVAMAFDRIEQNLVESSWKDAFSSVHTPLNWMKNVEVPSYGCLKDEKLVAINGNRERVLNNIWQIGGDKGWYYANGLWKIRGLLDKLFGGVGLRRGRTHSNDLEPGDALDFWRVLIADRQSMRLLLFAEMKLPGEAWLEFAAVEKEGKPYLKQTATFRPHGLWGRMYWYAMLPFHFFIFKGMANKLVE